MSSPSQQKLSTVEMLEQQQTHLETRISNLKSEVGALENRRSKVKGEIEAETNKLVKNRQLQLENIDSEAKKRFSDIKSDISAKKSELDGIESSIVRLNIDLAAIQKQLDDAKNELQTFTSLADDTKRRYGELTLENDRLTSSLSATTQKVADEEAKIPPLKEEIQWLQAEMVNLHEKKTKADQEFTATKESYEVRIGELESKLYTLTDKIRREQSQHEQERMDIAHRTKLLDEREVNLRVRERKVRDGEETIARNASLLDL